MFDCRQMDTQLGSSFSFSLYTWLSRCTWIAVTVVSSSWPSTDHPWSAWPRWSRGAVSSCVSSTSLSWLVGERTSSRLTGVGRRASVCQCWLIPVKTKQLLACTVITHPPQLMMSWTLIGRRLRVCGLTRHVITSLNIDCMPMYLILLTSFIINLFLQRRATKPVLTFKENFWKCSQLEKASTHKGAKDPRQQCFVTRDLDLWPIDPKINRFPGLFVEHFCVKFGDPCWIGFWNIVRKNRHRQTEVKALPPGSNAVGVSNNARSELLWSRRVCNVRRWKSGFKIVAVKWRSWCDTVPAAAVTYTRLLLLLLLPVMMWRLISCRPVALTSTPIQLTTTTLTTTASLTTNSSTSALLVHPRRRSANLRLLSTTSSSSVVGRHPGMTFRPLSSDFQLLVSCTTAIHRAAVTTRSCQLSTPRRLPGGGLTVIPVPSTDYTRPIQETRLLVAVTW